MRNIIFITLLFVESSFTVWAQVDAGCYWQQSVDYEISVELDTSTHLLTGFENIMYTNNSPDTLKKVFFHLYFNAFQPGSMMDERSRSIIDPDSRVKDYIAKLLPNEQGFQKIMGLSCNGERVKYSIEGTVMTVELSKPIVPGESARLAVDFEAQIPKQIRRTGRNNKEGIDYTVTQWYPKIAVYDVDGWHAEEYVGREFYGDFGSFDVTITIDSGYTIGGTGVLQNPDEVGHGYGNNKTHLNNSKLKWHFTASNVHDFAWAADPDYIHDTKQVGDSLSIHFFYQPDVSRQWEDAEDEVVDIFRIMNQTFGRYPYTSFSVIQGGDGGMEYPMCTMVLGKGKHEGKIGLIAHESIHNWYYGVLGTNEYRYPWMDEGMTTYAEEYVMNKLFDRHGKGFLKDAYDSYLQLVGYGQGIEEPMATPADLFNTNFAYSVSSYSKGAITLNMLRYIMGDKLFYSAMRSYFDEWKFKHPNPADFMRVMERESGIQLDWFFEHWLYTTHHIDYSVDAQELENGYTLVKLFFSGEFPMPIELEIELITGDKYRYYIPLRQMRGPKETDAIVLENWGWTIPRYNFIVEVPMTKIKRIVIDPDGMLPDVKPEDNVFPHQEKNKKNKR